MTDKQLVANRRNAAHATGPRTESGKAAASKNALQHGLLSQDTVLPDEDVDAFSTLREQLYAQYQPEGALECFLLERVAANMWRLNRLQRIEQGFFTSQHYEEAAAAVREDAKQYEHVKVIREDMSVELAEMVGPKTEITITNQAKHAAAMAKNKNLNELRQAAVGSIGRAFQQDATDTDLLSRLSRYEVTIERTLFRNLHELQRLQAARRGEGAPLPMAVDVDVRQEK